MSEKISHGMCIDCFVEYTGRQPKKKPVRSGDIKIVCSYCGKTVYDPKKRRARYGRARYRRNASSSGHHQLPSFGPYIIHNEIARGGQGAVYRATHRELGTPVAIKILLEPDHLGMKRFRQEAKVLARLDHPNILRVVDMGTVPTQTGDFPYIAMEYIEGQDLKQLIKEGYRWRNAAKALIKVARALHYCHQMGIVHRDLKPANILIENETQRPVIVDFGLVKRDAGKMGMASLDRSRLSVTGEVKGTPQYMAPEQLDVDEFGKEGPSVDIYALGGILYFILTGRPVFQGATAYNIMMKVMQTQAPDPREINPEIPSELAELALICLSKDPGDRLQDAEMFAEALEAALRPRKKLTRRSGRRGRGWLAAGLVAGGMLAGGLSFREAQTQRRSLRQAEYSAQQEAELARTRRPLVREKPTPTIVVENRDDPVASERALSEAHKAYQQRNYREAVLRATQALQLQATNTDAYLLLADAEASRGNLKKALNHAETVLTILTEEGISDDRYSVARRYQSFLTERLLSTNPAEDKVRRNESIQLYEQSVDLLGSELNRGVAFDDIDNDVIARAYDLVDRALEIWPMNAMAYVQRSALNVRRGDKLEARADVETALYIYNMAIESGQMDPDDPKVRDALQLKATINNRRRMRRSRR